MSPKFVEVAVNAPPVRGTFDYHLPSELENRVQAGHLVTAPFGRRRVQGVVVGTPSIPAVPETRPIEGLLDPTPVLTAAQLQLAAWLSDSSRAALIDCITLMLPPGLSVQADSLYVLVQPEATGSTAAQERLLALLKRRGPLRGGQVQRALPRQAWRRTAEALVRAGVLTRTPILKPPRAKPRSVRTVRLAVPPELAQPDPTELGGPGGNARQRRAAILAALIAAVEPVEARWLYAQTGASLRDLRFLEDRGWISLGEAEKFRDPLTDVDFVPSEPPTLTHDQRAVWAEIEALIQRARSGPSTPALLHGVTGSGKTELYLRAVAETLRSGRQAIVLVPEIALTPQTVRRFLSRFPGQIGLMHSQLSEGERYDTWRRGRAGELQVIVGARSALFSPLPDIGLIVLDESHDESYKEQGHAPRYHARDTALAYASILNAVCLFGSATPDLVTMYKARRGTLRHITLPRRILGHRERIRSQAARLGVEDRYQDYEGEAREIQLPAVRVIDMRAELRAGNTSIFSRALQTALSDTLSAHQQAILFLNRRGSATYIFCRDCGWVARCPHCSTTLTFHTPQAQLICHHCGNSRRPPKKCPQCSGDRVRHFGAGTQRVQAELERRFPGVRTLRWDWDATRTKGAHDVILSSFAAQRADVLVGTQMIAKGLDLPLVTLVGVVSADTALNLPDFRAAERTFQILTQVAGRAGRGILGGRVILQTYEPEHYSIQAASQHDYEAFYRVELNHRRQLHYPPFTRLARLVVRETSAARAEEEARRMAGMLRGRISKSEIKADLIGPAPCYYARVRGLHRWQLVLRSENPTSVLPETLPEAWGLDIDPVSLL